MLLNTIWKNIEWWRRRWWWWWCLWTRISSVGSMISCWWKKRICWAHPNGNNNIIGLKKKRNLKKKNNWLHLFITKSFFLFWLRMNKNEINNNSKSYLNWKMSVLNCTMRFFLFSFRFYWFFECFTIFIYSSFINWIKPKKKK